MAGAVCILTAYAVSVLSFYLNVMCNGLINSVCLTSAERPEELHDDFGDLPDCIRAVSGFGESRRLALGSLFCNTFKPSNYSYVHSSGKMGFSMNVAHLRGMACALIRHRSTFVTVVEKEGVYESSLYPSPELRYRELLAIALDPPRWGENEHIQALSIALGMPIYVFNDFLGARNIDVVLLDCSLAPFFMDGGIEESDSSVDVFFALFFLKSSLNKWPLLSGSSK